MKYKLTEDGKAIEMKGGHPVVIDGESEITIDAIGAQAKIATITAESNDRRKKLSDAATALEAFGDLDATAARKALEDVGGMSDKGKADLEAQRDLINKTWADKETTWETEKTGLNTKLFEATTGSQFATSKVIKGTVLPPDIAQATFGKHFNPDGSANDAAGNPIYSKTKPGELAGFDEAMTSIIDAYPAKDSIMKASDGAGGDGHSAGSGTGDASGNSSMQNISAGLKERGVS